MSDKVNQAAPMPIRTQDNLSEEAAKAGMEAAKDDGVVQGPLEGFVRLSGIVKDADTYDLGGVLLVNKVWRFLGNEKTRSQIGANTAAVFARSVPNAYCEGDIGCSKAGPLNLVFMPGDLFFWGEYAYDALSPEFMSKLRFEAGAYTYDTKGDDMGWAVMNGSKYHPGYESDLGFRAMVRHYFSHHFDVEAWASFNVMRDVDTNVLGNNVFSHMGKDAALFTRMVARLDGGHKLVLQGDVRHTWLNDDNGGGRTWDMGIFGGGSFNFGRGIGTALEGYLYRMGDESIKYAAYIDFKASIGPVGIIPYFMMTGTVKDSSEVGSSSSLTEGSKKLSTLNDGLTAGVKVKATDNLSFNAEYMRTAKGGQTDDRPTAPQFDSDLPESNIFGITATLLY